MPAPKGRKRFRRTVRLAQLELLAAMESAPTLSAAARAAHVAQPAASRLLRSLSSSIGIELFERAGRTLRPTPAGRVLLQRAASLMTDLDRIESELDAIDRGLIGTASLGAGFASCYVLIPNALEKLLSAAPRIAVNLREGPMEELTAKLREGRIDLLVGRVENSGGDNDLVTEVLYDPAMNVVCGPDHPVTRKRKLDWSDVLKGHWILPEAGTPMRTGVEDLFRRQRMRPSECLVESSSIQSNVVLLNSHNLFWVLSADIARYFEDLGQLRILSLPQMPGPAPFVIAYLRQRRLSAAAQRLLECLRQAARELNVTVPSARRKRSLG